MHSDILNMNNIESNLTKNLDSSQNYSRMNRIEERNENSEISSAMTDHEEFLFKNRLINTKQSSNLDLVKKRPVRKQEEEQTLDLNSFENQNFDRKNICSDKKFGQI